jgi:Pyridoxamine 5'-phosphate oxidase
MAVTGNGGTRPRSRTTGAPRRLQFAFLATASADSRPARTLVSWLYAADDRHVVLALDRRSLAFSDLLEDPYAAVEVVLPGFPGSVRGPTHILEED